jgi:hypothetical protein
MHAREALGASLQKFTVRFFLKGPGSAVVLAGTLALAGFGAAAAMPSAGAPAQPQSPAGWSSTLPSAYECFNDPDGDGTIKCGSSVKITSLPAAWGHCVANLYGDGLTVCDGTNR